MVTTRIGWTRQQLLVAFNLYCQIPFGKLHSCNPEIIKYADLIGRSSSALAMKLTNIASLDPAITSTGRKGLKGASMTDKAMWKEMQNDWDSFVLKSNDALELVNLENKLEVKLGDSTIPDKQIDYSGSHKIVQTKARVGQGFFRKAVLSAYNYQCCITGLSIPKLLVASHIVPWRKDEKNRLNPSNGLSLSILHDKAFDIGIITINNDMTVRVSQKIIKNDNDFYISALLNYDRKPIHLPEKFQPHADFLSYHQDNIYEQWEQ